MLQGRPSFRFRFTVKQGYAGNLEHPRYNSIGIRARRQVVHCAVENETELRAVLRYFRQAGLLRLL